MYQSGLNQQSLIYNTNVSWSYVPKNPSLWNGTPKTIAEAIDRIAISLTNVTMTLYGINQL